MGDLFSSVFNSPVLLGLVRSGVLAASASLVTNGWITGGQQEMIAGGVVGAITIVASAVSNYKKHRNKEVLKAVDKNAPQTLEKAAVSVGTTAAKVTK